MQTEPISESHPEITAFEQQRQLQAFIKKYAEILIRQQGQRLSALLDEQKSSQEEVAFEEKCGTIDSR